MKKILALSSAVALALAFGVVHAQSAPTHDHAAMMAAQAAAPAADKAPADPAAAGMPMGCPGAMMHGNGAMGPGAMMHPDGTAAGPGAMPGNCPMGMQGAMPCGQGMGQGMGMGMGMAATGDVDKDFAAMMIRHHQMGIRMADNEIANGKNPELKALAKKMRAAHLKEIEELGKHQ